MIGRLISYMGSHARAAFVILALSVFGSGCGLHDADVTAVEAVQSDAVRQAAGEVWAMQWTIPVRWNKNIGIDAGSGEVIHHARSVASTVDQTMTHRVRLCGVQQPSYRLRPILGKEQYQAMYPGEAVDAQSLPERTMAVHLGESGGFVAPAVALMLGGSIDDPEHAAWPAPGAPFPGTLETQADGSPGFGSVMRTDPPFVGPPVNMLRTRRAAVFHVAMRHLVGAMGAFVNDDYAEGRATVGGINGKAALNMRVVGCHLEKGGSCTDAELYDLNRYGPAYVVTGPGKFVMQRVPADTSCATIRTLAFAP